jgi:hypothetical protein
MQNLFHIAGYRIASGIKGYYSLFLKVLSYLDCYPESGCRKIVKTLLDGCEAECSFVKVHVLMK